MKDSSVLPLSLDTLMVYFPAKPSLVISLMNKIKKHWLPSCLKSVSPSRGIQISQFTVFRVMLAPLALVAVDIGSDGNVLVNMYSFSIPSNITNITNVTTVRLSSASAVILLLSLLSFLFKNPTKTLIRNVRASALMGSREMESRDTPVPIGDF